MLSIRLKNELETQVREQARRLQVSTSAFVRQALEEKLRNQQQDATPWALGQNLFGRYASNDGDRAERAEEHLRGKLRERHGR